ncbi:MAG TPA: glycosyltransferase, partial [Actinomycetota bacterium]
PNDLARRAWDFLRPYVRPADVYVFSRDAYVWEGLDRDRAVTIPPSIDAFSPKNQELDPEQVRSILVTAGLFTDSRSTGRPSFIHQDGSTGLVRRGADLSAGAPAPAFDAPTVVQVSRWDRLKDPLGVIRGFVDRVAPGSDTHLLLAGPSVQAVADDPEGAAVLAECAQAWSELPGDIAARIHLACLPMDDGEENAAIVNALQRRADVVVQKSLAEGFGLTVAEAMWKARPVVASRIGGIQDQVAEGTAVLVDPTDLTSYGTAVRRLLDDPAGATRMGEEAQRRVRDSFLAPRHLVQYLELIQPLLRRAG